MSKPRFHRVHPACSGVLLKPSEYSARTNNPACVFVWEHESRLRELIGVGNEDDDEHEGDEEYGEEDYEEDDTVYDDPEQRAVLERLRQHAEAKQPAETAPLEQGTADAIVSTHPGPDPTAGSSEQCHYCSARDKDEANAGVLPRLREIPGDIHPAEGCRHGHRVKDFSTFSLDRTVAFFGLHIGVIPADYLSLYPNKMTVLHFSVTGLSVLGQLDVVLPPGSDERKRLIEWVYGLQVQPGRSVDTKKVPRGGFRASPCFRFPSQQVESESSQCGAEFIWDGCGNADAEGDEGSLPGTYASLCTLLALGDDLSRVNVHSLLDWLRECQLLVSPANQVGMGDDKPPSILLQEQARRHGGFSSTLSERVDADVRFTYCAAVIPIILSRVKSTATKMREWFEARGFSYPASSSTPLQEVIFKDYGAAVQFLAKCQRKMQGGFALSPSCAEAHGGATYTAVASLAAMNALNAIPDRSSLERWLIACQGEGYRGRINKLRDSCYSFWTGATIALLGIDRLTCPVTNAMFNMRCHSVKTGGFGRDPASSAEIMHTFYSVMGLSLVKDIITNPEYELDDESRLLTSDSGSSSLSQAWELLNRVSLQKVSPLLGCAESIFDSQA